MNDPQTFSNLIDRIKELSERLAQSRTTQEKVAILREFRVVLDEGGELIEKN